MKIISYLYQVHIDKSLFILMWFPAGLWFCITLFGKLGHILFIHHGYERIFIIFLYTWQTSADCSAAFIMIYLPIFTDRFHQYLSCSILGDDRTFTYDYFRRPESGGPIQLPCCWPPTVRHMWYLPSILACSLRLILSRNQSEADIIQTRRLVTRK